MTRGTLTLTFWAFCVLAMLAYAWRPLSVCEESQRTWYHMREELRAQGKNPFNGWLQPQPPEC